MSRTQLFSVLFAFLSLFSLTAQAKTEVIISLQAPPEREYVMPPGGYVRCYMTPAEYHHDIWINSHKVCEYRGPRRAGIWVSGYWMCDKVKHHHKQCAHWRWIPSHWEGRSVVSYGPPVVTHVPPPPRVVVVGQTPPPPRVIVVGQTPPPPVHVAPPPPHVTVYGSAGAPPPPPTVYKS